MDSMNMPTVDIAKMATKNTAPVEEAAAYTADRLDRLEHVLGDLNGVVMRLGDKLTPVLTGGLYSEPPTDGDGADGGTPEDGRSAVARQFSAFGERADGLAYATTLIRRRLEAILDAVEL